MNKVKDAPQRAKQHTVYKNKAGIRVCGVTTFLGILNKPALVPWANNLGLQGIKVREYVDHLASIGTLAHLMVENHLKKIEGNYSEYSPDQIDRAENAVLKFYEWEKVNEFEVVHSELNLVSEEYQFGGCCDIYGILNGKLVLIDLKTSKACYSEHHTQVCAYKMLLEEHNYIVDDVKILRIGRDESEGFDEYAVKNIDLHQQLFRKCIEIYKLQKQLRKGA